MKRFNRREDVWISPATSEALQIIAELEVTSKSAVMRRMIEAGVAAYQHAQMPTSEAA